MAQATDTPTMIDAGASGISGMMSLEEFQTALGIRSYNKAAALAARDALPVPAVKIGRTYRFSRRLVDAFLAGEYTRPPAKAS